VVSEEEFHTDNLIVDLLPGAGEHGTEAVAACGPPRGPRVRAPDRPQRGHARSSPPGMYCTLYIQPLYCVFTM
jgi:hypothetical protein